MCELGDEELSVKKPVEKEVEIKSYDDIADEKIIKVTDIMEYLRQKKKEMEELELEQKIHDYITETYKAGI